MKALIVDDSKIVRSITAKMLDELGLNSDQAVDGVEAIEKMKSTEYQVVFLDWYMPEMDGLKFLSESRSKNLLGKCKVIVCTTENDPSKIEQALSSGADEYIMKPYDKHIVEDKLRILGLI